MEGLQSEIPKLKNEKDLVLGGRYIFGTRGAWPHVFIYTGIVNYVGRSPEHEFILIPTYRSIPPTEPVDLHTKLIEVDSVGDIYCGNIETKTAKIRLNVYLPESNENKRLLNLLSQYKEFKSGYG